jgi:hypothetical protein
MSDTAKVLCFRIAKLTGTFEEDFLMILNVYLFLKKITNKFQMSLKLNFIKNKCLLLHSTLSTALEIKCFEKGEYRQPPKKKLLL